MEHGSQLMEMSLSHWGEQLITLQSSLSMDHSRLSLRVLLLFCRALTPEAELRAD